MKANWDDQAAKVSRQWVVVYIRGTPFAPFPSASWPAAIPAVAPARWLLSPFAPRKDGLWPGERGPYRRWLIFEILVVIDRSGDCLHVGGAVSSRLRAAAPKDEAPGESNREKASWERALHYHPI